MKEKVVILRDNPRVRLRLTACFLSPPLFRNSIARVGSLFPRKRRYAQMQGAGGGEPSLRK